MPQFKSLLHPSVSTTLPSRRKQQPVELLYNHSSAHPHNPHTTTVHPRKRLSARLSSCHAAVNQIQQLNSQYYPQQEAAARAKAAHRLTQTKERDLTQVDAQATACVIQTLMEMRYFFSDFVDGGLFITQAGSTLRSPSNLEPVPLFFVAETLDRVFNTPSLLKDVPPLEFAHQLSGGEDVYFDTNACRLWLARIDALLHDLLHPIHSFVTLHNTYRMRMAWLVLRGDPLKRALDLARYGRLWYILTEHHIHINQQSMRRAWHRWKPLWWHGHQIIASMHKKRKQRWLATCWQTWQRYVVDRIFDSVNETKIDIGWRLLRDAIQKNVVRNPWYQWKLIDVDVQRTRALNVNQILMQHMWMCWQSFVQERLQHRQRKALSLLSKCSASTRRKSGTTDDEVRRVDLFRRRVVLQQSFVQWLRWKAARARLRNKVVDALERMGRQYVGMAFLVWYRRTHAKRGGKEIKKKKTRVKKITHCHMCSHVACPESCLYTAELKSRRSQWRHIEL